MKRYIGDVHGKFTSYTKIIRESLFPTIQVGDYGLGFYAAVDEHHLEVMKDYPQHRFIRGNHDNVDVCKTFENFIPDGKIEDDTMFIGGAWSIDKSWRIEGEDWWATEENSYSDFQKFIDIYETMKPRVMVTHDCPETISKQLFVDTGKSLGGSFQHKNLTASALQVMFEIHQPEVWIFGHWHCNADEIINGTRFICLEELAHIDL